MSSDDFGDIIIFRFRFRSYRLICPITAGWGGWGETVVF